MKRLAAAMVLAVATLLAACSSTISGQAAPASKVSTSTSTPKSAGTTDGASSSSSSSSTSKTSTSTSKTSTTSTSTSAATLPAGFDWWDEAVGIAYHGLNPDLESFECTGSETFCFAVSVYSAQGCPAGAQVVMTIYASKLSDEVLGTASNYTAAIEPGGTQLAIIGFNTDNADAAAGVTSISC